MGQLVTGEGKSSQSAQTYISFGNPQGDPFILLIGGGGGGGIFWQSAGKYNLRHSAEKTHSLTIITKIHLL